MPRTLLTVTNSKPKIRESILSTAQAHKIVATGADEQRLKNDYDKTFPEFVNMKE